MLFKIFLEVSRYSMQHKHDNIKNKLEVKSSSFFFNREALTFFLGLFFGFYCALFVKEVMQPLTVLVVVLVI